jgi:hypothetical protein
VRPVQPAALESPLASALGELGIPAVIAARAVGRDPYDAILTALSTLPKAPRPPDQPGDVLIIAGELGRAARLAELLARRLRLSPTNVLLAGPTTAGTGIHSSRRISGPAEARRRARLLHREETPHLVVVDTPIENGAAEWTRTVADAMGATAVWAVVDATRKTADLTRYLRALGPVDALAVHAIADTADPASVLGLPSPKAWAALLTERLGEVV